MKRIVSYGTIGAIGFSSGYILTSETRRRKAKRALLFWSKALPVYMRYRWEEYKTKDWSEEDKDKAFDRLHKVEKVFDVVLRQSVILSPSKFF